MYMNVWEQNGKVTLLKTIYIHLMKTLLWFMENIAERIKQLESPLLLTFAIFMNLMKMIKLKSLLKLWTAQPSIKCLIKIRYSYCFTNT